MFWQRAVFINLAVSVGASVVTTFLVLFLLSASNTNTSAQPPAGTAEGLLTSAQQAVQQAALPGTSPATGQASALQMCKSHMEKLCAKETSASNQIECLQEHFNQVSEACHARLQAGRDSFAPCQDDITRFCAEAGYGGGRMMNCLRGAGAKLSISCARFVRRS
jgi:Cysteine rich repeat